MKIAKITAFTIIVSSFILGAFILASSYLQAKASCDQVQALDSVLEKELMLETLQQVNKVSAICFNAQSYAAGGRETRISRCQFCIVEIVTIYILVGQSGLIVIAFSHRSLHTPQAFFIYYYLRRLAATTDSNYEAKLKVITGKCRHICTICDICMYGYILYRYP